MLWHLLALVLGVCIQCVCVCVCVCVCAACLCKYNTGIFEAGVNEHVPCSIALCMETSHLVVCVCVCVWEGWRREWPWITQHLDSVASDPYMSLTHALWKQSKGEVPQYTGFNPLFGKQFMEHISLWLDQLEGEVGSVEGRFS